MSLSEISDFLNAKGVVTPGGKTRWTKYHVDRLLHTRHIQELDIKPRL